MSWQKILRSRLFLATLLTTLLVFSYFFAQELGDRYQLENEIRGLQRQIEDVEKSKKELTDLIDYFRSPSFQEKEVRRKLSLQKPGEHAVAFPVATSTAPSTARSWQEQGKPQNWGLWWEYFFGQR